MEKQKEKPLIGIALMLTATLFNAFGSYFFRIASVNVSPVSFVLGLILYCVGNFSAVAAFRFGKLGAIAPVQGFTYVWTVFIACILLSESLSVTRIAGIALIIGGVALIGKSDS